MLTKDESVGLTATIRSSTFLQVAFNVLFFVPLGFLVAYAARRGVGFALVTGLVVSVLIETTLGTGI